MLDERLISGRRCRHFECDSAEVPDQAAHGDMVIVGEKQLTGRSRNVFFVCEPSSSSSLSLSLNGGSKASRKSECEPSLVQKERAPDSTGDGRCCVPLEVTSRMRDPIEFYEGAFTFDAYDEIDFEGIEIDTRVHQDVIKRFTGGRAVDPARQCFFFLSRNEWDSSGGMFIWCDFYLDDFDLGRYVKLTPDIDASLLAASPAQQRDPRVLAGSLETARVYEREFTQTLATTTKPGQSVDVFGAAFFDPLVAQDSADVFVMKFVRAERTTTDTQPDHVTAIILASGHSEEENTTTQQQQFRFTRRVLTQYGRFGGVKFWCADVPVSVIDGDCECYENEPTRICVIFTSDLFF